MSVPERAERNLAYVAAEIMFSEGYVDLLERIYSAKDSIVKFESSPREVLVENGIDIPSGVEVVLHDPGDVGRPARVDFHWEESAVVPSDPMVAVRDRARLAWDLLHSPQMMHLRESVRTSRESLERFASDPRAYAAQHSVSIPEDFEVVLHTDDPDGPRIDLHFRASATERRLSYNPGGCCYCRGGECCYYVLM